MAFDKEKTLAAAQKYQDKGQYEKAIREYNKVLEAEPNDDRTMLSLARCYEGADKMPDAGQMYKKVIQIYRDTGAYQKAIAISKQALKCLPDDEEITIGMAELNNAIGLSHEAVSLLEKCLNRHNRETDGEGYLRILTQMVRFDSENVQTRLRYAETLNYLGDVESAKRQYSLVLALYLGKERYVDYIQTARDYLKLEPHDEEVLCELGQIYIKMERYNDSLAIMSDLDPSKRSAEMRELFVTCYKRLGRKNDAINELKALARQLKAEGGREERIENVWHQVQQLSPNDPDAAAAFNDVPLLSDSALNAVVSPAVENERRNGIAPEVSQQERELAQKFMQALESYRLGNVEEAKYLCQQILCVNLNYVSALQLLSQIFENEQEHPLQAQVERQLAKVAFATDVNEAVRHVLKAERCMPGAVENYNLLLMFGVDPTQYGLGNANGVVAAPPGPPPVGGRPNTPPVPPARNIPNAARPPMPPQAYPYQGGQPGPAITSNRLDFDIDDEELSAVDEELDGAFDLMFGGPRTSTMSSQNMYKLQIEDVPPMDDYEDYDDDDDSSRTIAHDFSSLTAAVNMAQEQEEASYNTEAEQSQIPYTSQSQVQSQFSQQASPQYNNAASGYSQPAQPQNPFVSQAQVQSQFSAQYNAQASGYAQAEQSQLPAASQPPVAPQPPATSQPPVAPQPPATSQPPVAPQPPAPSQFSQSAHPAFNSDQTAAFAQPEQPQVPSTPHQPTPNPFPQPQTSSAPHPPVPHLPVPGHFPKQTPAPFNVQAPSVENRLDVNAQSNLPGVSNSSMNRPVPRIASAVSGGRLPGIARKYPSSGVVPAAPSSSSHGVVPPAPSLPTPGVVPPTPAVVPPTPAVVPPTPAVVPPTPAVVPPTPAVVPPTPAVVPPTPAVVPPTPAVVPPTPAVVPPTPAVVPPTIPSIGVVPPSPVAPSSVSAVGRPAVPGMNAARPLGVVLPRIPGPPVPAATNKPLPTAQATLPSAGLSNGNYGQMNKDVASALSGIPGISMPASTATIPYAEPVQAEPVATIPYAEPVRMAGIPDSERQKVEETLQEVEFYASLMLEADARTVLQGLIDKYGDVDIIHEAKVKLDGGA